MDVRGRALPVSAANICQLNALLVDSGASIIGSSGRADYAPKPKVAPPSARSAAAGPQSIGSQLENEPRSIDYTRHKLVDVHLRWSALDCGAHSAAANKCALA